MEGLIGSVMKMKDTGYGQLDRLASNVRDFLSCPQSLGRVFAGEWLAGMEFGDVEC